MFLDSYQRLIGNPDAPEEAIREALQEIVDLYEAWGGREKVAEYQSLLTARQ